MFTLLRDIVFNCLYYSKSNEVDAARINGDIELGWKIGLIMESYGDTRNALFMHKMASINGSFLGKLHTARLYEQNNKIDNAIYYYSLCEKHKNTIAFKHLIDLILLRKINIKHETCTAFTVKRIMNYTIIIKRCMIYKDAFVLECMIKLVIIHDNFYINLNSCRCWCANNCWDLIHGFWEKYEERTIIKYNEMYLSIDEKWLKKIRKNYISMIFASKIFNDFPILEVIKVLITHFIV